MSATFSVREYGAKGDGNTADTTAIQAAVDACHAAGGGTVHCPPGEYLTGTVQLKSNVELSVEAGATLAGSADPADYPELEYGTVFPASRVGPQHLVFAHKADNVAITGRGTIDGNGRAFFGPCKPGETHLSVPGWRPSHMIAFVECRDVLIRDVRLVDSPLYTVWPLGCERVRIHGVTILNNREGPNTDGIDPDCCRSVVISDCYIDAGDDCIALKSHDSLLGRPVPCENITVTNCVLSTTCCGVRIGYEGDGPIRNCTFSNLAMPNTRTGINVLVPRHAEIGIEHGPAIENITFSNIVMDTRIPIYLWIGDDAAPPGGIRNVSISDVIATADRASYIGGSRSIPVETVRLSNIDLTVRGQMDDELADVPYPYPVFDDWTKRGIPDAFYCRYARDLAFRDVRVRWGDVTGPWRSALRAEYVDELELSNFIGAAAPHSQTPAVHLTETIARPGR